MLFFEMPKDSSWEYIKNSGKPVVIYGMGNGADRVLDEFARLDIPVLGVTASDSFVRGQLFRGYRVKKLSDFGGDFIIAIAFGTCIPEVINHIYSLKENYDVIVPVVPVYGDDIFNREFVEANKDRINKAYNLFSEKSKKIYADCIRFMFSGDLDLLKQITTEKDEIFSTFLNYNDNESYVDLGAYKGDTVEEFLKNTKGKYNTITAVEPDEKNCRKMTDKLCDLHNFDIHNKVISNKDGVIRFDSAGGRNSSVEKGNKYKECVTVDTLCKDKKVTYIKVDIEGEEMAMLEGAVNTLKEQAPKLNIALYHRSADIFEIPLKIKEIYPGYEFEIRHHPYIPYWDTNLYAKKKA